MSKGRRYITCILGIIETVILTGIYYLLWRIGYTHGIPGYPEYLGFGKFVLMAIYAFMLVVVMFFSGGFSYGKFKPVSIIVRQWFTILAVNVITYMQLSLTAKHLVAKRPMFDATVIQAVLIVVYAIISDAIEKRFRAKGSMIAVGDGIEEGQVIDGYKVSDVERGSHDMTGISHLFDRIDSHDAVAVSGRDEAFPLIIRHCIEKRIPVYVSATNPLVYGVRRPDSDGENYVLVLGINDGSSGFIDRMRAYLT